jgi:iron complex transport system substrate-binding protein
MRDTTYIKLVIFGKKPKTDFADANYDGKVSMLDVGQTKLIILGKEKKLTLIDLADRTVTIDKPVERIILQSSGSGGAFYTLFALEGKDAPEKIVGWDPGLKKYRMWIYEKFLEACPELENIPNVGSGGDLSVEQVISLNTDVFILPAYSWKTAKDVFEKVEQAGIPILTIDYHTETLETHWKSIMLLGRVLDREERAQELVDYYEEQVNEVYSRLEKIDKPMPKVYVECGSKGPSEYGNTYGNYMWGALIEKCGGINIAEGVIERWAPINPEYLLDANPDVIIITGSNWPKSPGSMKLGYYADSEESRELLKAFTERPGWDTLNAVKNNRVYSTHHGISRDIWDFVPIQFMAKCFYPEEFDDLDPEESFKEFHEKFLPVDYSGVWMMSLEE